nr:2-dehydropantoate 2-reductase [Rhizobium sp. ACO-34A]
MKITVFGAGAVGCHFAARMARAGVGFTLVARPATARAIEREGLRFISTSEDFTVPVTVVDDTRNLGPQDAVIVALKAYSLAAALDDLAPLLGSHTTVVFAVNGIPWWYGLGGQTPLGPLDALDPGGRIASRIGIDRSAGCVVHSANMMEGTATVRNISTRNRFFLGAAGASPLPQLAPLTRILAGSLDEVVPADDIRREVWKKLLHNLPASLIGCLTRSRADQIAASPRLSDLYRQVREEARRVALALGIELADDTDAQLRHMSILKHRASMLQDLLAGRRLEIDAQVLAVREIAARCDVPVPKVDLLATLLQALEANSSADRIP